MNSARVPFSGLLLSPGSALAPCLFAFFLALGCFGCSREHAETSPAATNTGSGTPQGIASSGVPPEATDAGASAAANDLTVDPVRLAEDPPRWAKAYVGDPSAVLAVDPRRLAGNPDAVMRWAVAYEDAKVDRASPVNKRAYEKIMECEALAARGYEKMLSTLLNECTKKHPQPAEAAKCSRDARNESEDTADEYERACFPKRLKT